MWPAIRESLSTALEQTDHSPHGNRVESEKADGMRIILKYAYIWSMKARLNLTIDNTLLENIKGYAIKQKTSVSELVENYFKSVTKPAKRKNILTMVDELKKPTKVDTKADLKESYYQDKAKKYGF